MEDEYVGFSVAQPSVFGYGGDEHEISNQTYQGEKEVKIQT